MVKKLKPGDMPATADDELLQRACANVRYTVNDMKKLRALFAKHDADNSGTLDIDEFYNLFEAKKNPFGDALFRMVPPSPICSRNAIVTPNA